MTSRRAASLPWIISLAVVGATAGAEWLEGRRWWCACGQGYLWESDIWSEHCSQHLADPYAFSHLAHGLVFYAMLAWIPGPWQRMSFAWKFCVANLVECAWEVLENSEFIIQRYRAETISIGYVGDSIINSMGDVLAAALGVLVARLIGWKWTLLLFVAVEVAMAATIKDNLTLNVIMLVWPIEAIKKWQSAGHSIGVSPSLLWPRR
ncbi:MAG TPA: DUF2585 family protein [Phycisphaerales bacterium]|nr:DUF2585 family protein [Phycisphaerales bacterium]